MNSLLELFCDVDDFCQSFVPIWWEQMLSVGEIQRERARSLSVSEIMAILIFSSITLPQLQGVLYWLCLGTFAKRVSRLGQLQRFCGIHSFGFASVARLFAHRLFGDLHRHLFHWFHGTGGVQKSKNPLAQGLRGTGPVWQNFYRLVFRLQIALVQWPRWVAQPHAHVWQCDDRNPVLKMVRTLFGKLFADKGYISKALREELLRTFNVQLVTGIRSNMKNMLMPLMDKLLMRKRAIIETIIDQLKNISQIEHSRHRSPTNFLVNLICGLIAYCRQPKKASLGLGTLPALVP